MGLEAARLARRPFNKRETTTKRKEGRREGRERKTD